MNKLTLLSYAKLNLFLRVINKRRDNYHNIETVFERIGLCDKVILKSRSDKCIKIICQEPSVPKDSTNLCYRSAKLLQDTFKIESGLDIKIIKRIPVGAGLGGGSSDAASVLLGLNRLWKLNLSQKKIAEYAAKLGSDIPFFICNIPFARGEGRGEKIKPLGGLRDVRLDHILVVPKIKVSTPLIYRKWDRFSKLTVPNYDDKILNLALRKKGLIQRPDLLFNGLEEVTTRLYPQLKRIKEKLMQLGLKSILMSGSGPAIFGIVSSKKEAVSLRRKLRKVNKSWRVFVTRTF